MFLDQLKEFIQCPLVIVPHAFTHLNQFLLNPIGRRRICPRDPVRKRLGGTNFHCSSRLRVSRGQSKAGTTFWAAPVGGNRRISLRLAHFRGPLSLSPNGIRLPYYLP
jgi:hypothetical protein